MLRWGPFSESEAAAMTLQKKMEKEKEKAFSEIVSCMLYVV